MSSLPGQSSSQSQNPSQYAPMVPAPRVPLPLEIENIGMEVREGENIAHGWRSWAAIDDGYEPPAFTVGDLEGKRVQRVVSKHRYDAALLQQARTRRGLAVTLEMKFRVTPDDAASKRERPQGIVVGVGIDPTGGENVRSDNVQWALRDLKYSQVVTASVTAIAQNDVVTAFVRTIAFIPGSDGTSGGGSANQCPRVCPPPQFNRTYLLLPPAISQQQWAAAAGIAYAARWTMGGSADDAGLGASLLSSRPVVEVVNYNTPGAWDRATFGPQWFAQNYPPGVDFRTNFNV